jgi:hypothetical protein
MISEIDTPGAQRVPCFFEELLATLRAGLFSFAPSALSFVQEKRSEQKKRPHRAAFFLDLNVI